MNNDSYDSIGCKDLLKGYLRGIFEFDDYAGNITRIMMGTKEEFWGSCLDTIPPDVVPLYLCYLRDEIEACDFKPFPYIYLFGLESDDEIERTKTDLRPKYVALVSFAKSRLTQ
jgi:hypothetical protein